MRKSIVSRVSFPAWLTMLLLSIVTIILRVTLEDLPLSDRMYSVLADVTMTLFSVFLLDFLLEVSSITKLTEKIIDRVQTRIIDAEDYSGFSIENKKHIIGKVWSANGKAKENMNSDFSRFLVQFGEQMAVDYEKNMSSSIYYESFIRSVVITLHADEININTEDSIIIANPLKERCQYVHKPLFYTNKESESYEVVKLAVNNEEISYEKNDAKNKTAEENRFYVEGNRIVVSIDSKTKTRIHQETRYKVDYNLFFQTYCLRRPCKEFALRAKIEDRRPQSQEKYILRWELFAPENRANIASDKMNQNRDSISIDPIENLPAGSGYVLCLSSKSN